MENMYTVTALVDSVEREVKMTEDMLREAYNIQAKEYAVADIKSVIELKIEYEEFEDDEEELVKKLMTPEVLEHLGNLYLKNGHCDWYEHAAAIVDDWVWDYEVEKEKEARA